MGPSRELYGVTVTVPTIATAVGVDGGNLFQIVGLEELGIDARAMGIGLSLGVLSVPLQLWAGRLPLWRARRHLQVYLAAMGLLAWVLALLVVAAPPGSAWASIALVVAVTAEIVLSVFFATSWQPLQSSVLTSRQRQRLASWGRAAAGALLGLSLVVFGSLGTTGRVVFLVVTGLVAVAQAVLVGRVPSPPRPATPPAPVDTGEPRPHRPAARPPLPRELAALCLTAGLASGTGWPLFVTYVDDGFWPGANLGTLAAVQLTGGIAAGLLWRPTVDGLVRRARVAAAGLVTAAAAVALVGSPVTGATGAAVTLAAAAGWSLAFATLLAALMELAHQVLDDDVTVRAFTVYDVVASTSMQVGLLVAGLLVAAGAGVSLPLDPYRTFLVAGAAAVTASTLRPGWPGPRWSARGAEAAATTGAAEATGATGAAAGRPLADRAGDH